MRWEGIAARSTPSITIEPAVGRIRPEMTRISVVLPAPFGPMTPTASPSRTSIDTSNSAWKVPYPARTPFSSSMGLGGYRAARDGARGARLGAEIHLDHAGIGRHLGGKALGDLLAVVEHHHAVHHPHQDAHDVLHPDDRDVEVLRDPAQQVGGLVHLVLVQTAQALVGEQERWRRGEGLGELELLERRRPQPVDHRRAIGGQAHQLERPLRRLEGPRARVPALAVEAGEHHVLENGQPVKRPRNLKGAADAEVDDPVRRLPADLPPLEPDGAAVGHERPGQHVEDGALARAVGADQAEDLALGDLERDVVDGGEAAEALGESSDAQHERRSG